jgi:hypothetical protein
MTQLNNTIRYNAEAAGLILSGRYSDALKILSTTLQNLKKSASNQDNVVRRQRRGKQLQVIAASELGENQYSCLSSSISAPNLSTPAPLPTPAAKPQTSSSSGYVFREPIVISDFAGESPVTAHRRMIATILYNLALAHHLQGLRLQKGETNTKAAGRVATYHLQTAQSMYQSCLKVQIKYRFDLGDFYKLLVIPNNTGQAAMALGKTQSAKGYMAFLAKQLDQYLQQENKNSTGTNFPCREHEIEEFLHNTTRLSTPFGVTKVVPC